MKILSRSITVAFLSAAACLSADIAPGESTPGGAPWPGDYPSWWYNAAAPANGVIDATLPVLNEGNDAPLALGQLKHIASEARDELDDALAAAGGAGLEIDTLVNGFTTVDPSNLSPANIGQLKAVSSVFYDRFVEVGFTPASASAGWPTGMELIDTTGATDNSPLYPWLDKVTAVNASLANLGQAKHLFSWDVKAWADLEFNLSDFLVFPEVLNVTLGYFESVNEVLELNNSLSPDVNFSVTLLNNDATGQVSYTAEDSLTGSATYQWNDISSSGSVLYFYDELWWEELYDNGWQELTLSNFSFPFYGTAYSNLYVSTNGLITFGAGSYASVNQSIPFVGSADNFIAPFWDDLFLYDQYYGDGGGYAYYLEEPDRLTIQYEGVESYDGTNTYTFQVVLHSNGEIEYFYKQMGDVSSATVGIESPQGSAGLQLAHNAAYIQDGIAIHIQPSSVNFVDVSPLSGVTPTGTKTNLDVTFQAHGLAPGTYNSTIQIAHNGTGSSPLTVPVSMTIVNEDSSVSITSPESGLTIWQDQGLELEADATDGDYGIESLKLYVGETEVGEFIYDDYYYYGYYYDWSNPVIGSYALTARAIDQFGTVTISDPVNVTVLEDTDGDRLEDGWEMLYWGDLSAEASGDSDEDDLTNLQEYAADTHPLKADTDGDQMEDGWEWTYGLDPNDASDASGDADSDSLTNLDEFFEGTDPTDPDTDGDELPDDWELDYGLDPLDDGTVDPQNGGLGDFDGDGAPNLLEYDRGTLPNDDSSEQTPVNLLPVVATLVPDQPDVSILEATDYALRFTVIDTDSEISTIEVYQDAVLLDEASLEEEDTYSFELDTFIDGIDNILQVYTVTVTDIYGAEHSQLISNVTILADSDSDRMPDQWELDYGLDPLDDGTVDPNNGGLGDFDGDGAPNLLEYDRGTLPNDDSAEQTPVNLLSVVATLVPDQPDVSILEATDYALRFTVIDTDSEISTIEVYQDAVLLDEASLEEEDTFSFELDTFIDGIDNVLQVYTVTVTDIYGAEHSQLISNVTILADSDSDRMSDQWELAVEHFGDLDEFADGDYDSDGAYNRYEYEKDTHPNDTSGTPENTPANTPAVLTLDIPTSALEGQEIEFSATVTDVDTGVQRVEFYVDSVLVGETTDAFQDTFNFEWLVDAQPGQVAVFVRAIDEYGHPTDSGIVTITIAGDADANGIEDSIETAWSDALQQDPALLSLASAAHYDPEGLLFGNPANSLAIEPVGADFSQSVLWDYDGDGISNYQEFLDGTGPSDFFNGQTPILTIWWGDGQVGLPEVFLEQTLYVKVENAEGVGYSNAPVQFSVVGGHAGLSQVKSISDLQSVRLLRTLASGAQVYFYTPALASGTLDTTVNASLPSGQSINLTLTTDADYVEPLSPPYAFKKVDNGDGTKTYTWRSNHGTGDFWVQEEQPHRSGNWVQLFSVSYSSLDAPTDGDRYTVTVDSSYSVISQ